MSSHSKTNIKRTLSNASSNKGSSSSPEKRRVSFGNVEHQLIATLPSHHYADVFYTRKELKELQQQEIMEIKMTMESFGTCDVELFDCMALTWRGLEDVKKGLIKTNKIKHHVREVVKECARQQKAGSVDNSALCAFSKRTSRPDRATALKLAAKDAEFVGQKGTTVTSRPFHKTIGKALNLWQRPRSGTTIAA